MGGDPKFIYPVMANMEHEFDEQTKILRTYFFHVFSNKFGFQVYNENGTQVGVVAVEQEEVSVGR